MQFRAYAFFLCAGLPLAAQAAPTVSFTAPGDGQTVSGELKKSACEVTGSAIRRVTFFLDSTKLNTDQSSPWNCNFDTLKFSDGVHTLKAVAYDSAGASASAQISVNISNGNEPPAVSIQSPTGGATISGYVSACAATATDSDGIKQVQWFLDSTLLNTELLAPYDTCNIDSKRFTDGVHTLKVVATDNLGLTGSAQVSVNTANPPAVAIQSPTEGATISGYVSACAATASDADGIKQVQWFLDSTLLNTELLAPYDTCNIDSKAFPDGIHTLKVVATDNAGRIGSAQVNVSIKNAAAEPKAIPTFESLGLYWTPPSSPASGACDVRYRTQGAAAWNEALPMWYDARNGECRGSIVHLAPGTTYDIEFSLPGESSSVPLSATTWSEAFPVARIVEVPSGATTLSITEGGTASGYVLYTSPAGTQSTIDVANTQDFNITISAPYVIVRGLTLKGARIDGVRLLEGAHDVVIEDNDISGWGRIHPEGRISSDGWVIGQNGDSGITARCNGIEWLQRTIIQRNRIHHPRYGSNSWSDGHPEGPNAVLFKDCGGNHVFRHNEIYSETGKWFMDAYGGGSNFSTQGMPNADSDLYGNIIRHVWDDAIEAEGANANVRVWGNYFDETTTGVATTSTSRGPVYIWRNVWNRGRHFSMSTLDGDSRLYMFKSGSASGFGDGRRYVFHNTMLQAPPPAGSTYPLGGGSGLAGPGSTQLLTNTVSRNNVFHIWKSWWNAIYNVGAGNDLDYDLTNGGFQAYAGAEPNGIIGTPIYETGQGWESESGGQYQLSPASPGYDGGARLPNFNDGFTGVAPDMGAHEAGTPAMRFGVQ
jgi:hypothetical protein